jgi:hypothetical protein
MKLESLHRALEEISNSPFFAIQASEYSATRTESLATGKAGLELAIHEYTRLSDESCKQIVFDSIQNIFSCCFVNNGGLVLTEPMLQKPQSPYLLGDVFNGYASEVWSNAVLNLNQIDKQFEDKPGDVIRPGLGHGELSRDLAKWIVAREPRTFFPQLDEGLGIGWCNGKSGLLSALGVYFAYSNDPDALDSMDKLSDELFLETQSCLQSVEYGLCHGISGSFVSMAGAARLAGKKDFLESLRISYGDWITKLNYTLIPPQLLLDNSWLTGSSGVLWAYAVLEKTPEFNPIFPPDSERWNK